MMIIIIIIIGEQWLGPYENCCLGSINLLTHFNEKTGFLDWKLLRETVYRSVSFLDDVISANKYVPSVPQLKKAAFDSRRIGLGIMDLSGLMIKCGIAYGTEKGEDFAGHIMEYIRYHAMVKSVELAKERGSFLKIKGSIFDPECFSFEAPKPFKEYTSVFARPEILNWDELIESIKENGIRNSCVTTVAPTGTIATVSGCEGYGCEPIFAFAHIRHVNDNGKDLVLSYASGLFKEGLAKLNLSKEDEKSIIDRVANTGTCKNILQLPESFREIYRCSSDLTGLEHVRMQAALQAFVDNSISKTCNFPESSTIKDVAQAYISAYEFGCKGLTVYVTGSRQKVVLETKETLEKKNKNKSKNLTKEDRPYILNGVTIRQPAVTGQLNITINEFNGDPFEVFIVSSKSGTDIAAYNDAIGRLISLNLRMVCPNIDRKKRANEIIKQLQHISGSNSIRLTDGTKIVSDPDAIAGALANYMHQKSQKDKSFKLSDSIDCINKAKQENGVKDVCTECHKASAIKLEGCITCTDPECGYSKCS